MDFYAAQFIIVAHKKLSMSFLIACRSCGRARLQLRYQCTIDEVEHFCVCQTVHFSLNMNLLPFMRRLCAFQFGLYFNAIEQPQREVNVCDRMGNRVRERANREGNRETKNKLSHMHSTSIFCPNIHVKSSFPLMFIMCV